MAGEPYLMSSDRDSEHLHRSLGARRDRNSLPSHTNSVLPRATLQEDVSLYLTLNSVASQCQALHGPSTAQSRGRDGELFVQPLSASGTFCLLRLLLQARHLYPEKVSCRLLLFQPPRRKDRCQTTCCLEPVLCTSALLVLPDLTIC